jgi:threonyl-tRNA synthetase
VRIVPVSEKFKDFAKEITEKLEKEKIRVDLDNRNLTVQKKIRSSEMEWVPYTIVVGEKEKESKMFPIRIRESGSVKKMKLEEFVKIIREEVDDKPFKGLPLQKRLTDRPKFIASI